MKRETLLSTPTRQTFRYLPILTLVVASLSAGLGEVQAGAPPTMTYQGRLTDHEGHSQTGLFNMHFAIYPDSAATEWIWNETHNNTTEQVLVSELGLFEVELGRFNPLSAGLFPADGSTPYLEITVNGEVLSPRKPLNSVPYAYAYNAGSTGPPWECDDIAPDIVSSINGVSQDCGDIELYGEGNIEVVPEPESHRIKLVVPPAPPGGMRLIGENANSVTYSDPNTWHVAATADVPTDSVDHAVFVMFQVHGTSVHVDDGHGHHTSSPWVQVTVDGVVEYGPLMFLGTPSRESGTSPSIGFSFLLLLRSDRTAEGKRLRDRV